MTVVELRLNGVSKVLFDKSVIPDLSSESSAKEMRNAALEHMKERDVDTSVRVKKRNFAEIACQWNGISSGAIHIVTEKLGNSDFFHPLTDEERAIARLLQEVNVVTSHVPGSNASKVKMRNEIRAMMIEKGLPSFYITLNPADVFNPIISVMVNC
ncbi:hypothetical protein CC1G_05071 [Coprinopsis cinerea okayama7|uniref:Helitron helicase-like domain-containing protein n=1 Tax=Coprinopsis cinerea (strain Okayama-7 / 130 / ATCC MYA-4618 / FGSC 9003) TaxID=240176 RepID=A8NSR7_COPC7|nr:hypothetical protein CC1G_05071 [Coprinopsis cinerea okayama7\|eukprot:XP_001836078.2 hypothetical protein CC1G_05071 [Coprinopsis cinerea okayama7\